MTEMRFERVNSRTIREDLDPVLNVRMVFPRHFSLREQLEAVKPLCRAIVDLLNTIPEQDGASSAALMKVSDAETDKFVVVDLVFGGSAEREAAHQLMATLAERVNSTSKA